MENKKPIIIEIEETKNELIQCINSAIHKKGIPCYFLEPIVSDLLRDVKAGAKRELAMAREQIKEGDK